MTTYLFKGSRYKVEKTIVSGKLGHNVVVKRLNGKKYFSGFLTRDKVLTVIGAGYESAEDMIPVFAGRPSRKKVAVTTTTNEPVDVDWMSLESYSNEELSRIVIDNSGSSPRDAYFMSKAALVLAKRFAPDAAAPQKEIVTAYAEGMGFASSRRIRATKAVDEAHGVNANAL